MEGQLIREFIENRLRELGLKRKDIPKLLGYENANKCFRLLDRLFTGSLQQHHLIDRIASSPLGGDEFQKVYVTEVLEQWNAVERDIEAALEHDERTFRPHLWVINEHDVPRPIITLTLFGIDHFKRLDLPEGLHAIENLDQRLDEIERYICKVIDDVEVHARINSVFGAATLVLYRDEYYHSYVFDVPAREFIGWTKDVPSYPMYYTYQGKRMYTFKR